MKKACRDALKTATVATLVAVVILTAFWGGFGVGVSRPKEVVKEVVVTQPISQGVKNGEIYTVEMWDDGEVRVVTTQAYINQLSERTILITDRNLDEVQEELFDMMDMSEGEND